MTFVMIPLVAAYLLGVGVIAVLYVRHYMAKEAQSWSIEMDDQDVALSWLIGFVLGFLWPLVVACGVLVLIGGSVVRRLGLGTNTDQARARRTATKPRS